MNSLVFSVTSFIDQHDRWALFLMFVLLTLESFGLPLPGETALVACSVLASQGSLSIASVVVVGVVAAVVGDNSTGGASSAGTSPAASSGRRRSPCSRTTWATPRGARSAANGVYAVGGTVVLTVLGFLFARLLEKRLVEDE